MQALNRMGVVMVTGKQAIRAIPQKGRGEMVEAALRKAIVLGTLEPGAALRELELADRFDCAQGTVREARGFTSST